MNDISNPSMPLDELRDPRAAPAPAFSVDGAFGRVAAIRRRRLTLAGAAAVVVVALAIAVPARIGHGGGTAQPAAPHVTASVRSVSLAEANAIMPDGNAPVPPPGGELVAGTVTWTPPANDDGMIVTVYLWDKNTGKAPGFWEPTSTKVTIDGDPADGRLAQRYKWLAPIAWVRDGKNGWTNYAASLTASPSIGSITFVAMFNPPGSEFPRDAHYQSTPIDVNDLVVALTYHDVDGNGGWAVRAAG